MRQASSIRLLHRGFTGNVGQANYGAAKAGIASLTIIAAMELQRYDVTVNAIAPSGVTRMTQGLMPDETIGDFRPADPANVSPLVVWLASDHARLISGRVFNIFGSTISVAEGWHAGPNVDIGRRWTPADFDDAIPDLLTRAPANADIYGQIPTAMTVQDA